MPSSVSFYNSDFWKAAIQGTLIARESKVSCFFQVRWSTLLDSVELTPAGWGISYFSQRSTGGGVVAGSCTVETYRKKEVNDSITWLSFPFEGELSTKSWHKM